jgi:hypothetical protein
VIAGIGGLMLALTLTGARTQPSGDNNAGPSQEAAAGVARKLAVTWILHQVSRAAIVSCDPNVCADLASKGFPPGSLLTLNPLSNDPLGSDLVVASAAIRAQYGRRLASVYAPAILARFGSGNGRIDIRLVFSGGSARYQAAERAALRVRKTADRQLLANSHVKVSATARADLRRGDIDPRLLLLIVTMAHSQRIRIVDFGGAAPGGGPGSLRRSVELAPVEGAAHPASAKFITGARTFIEAQRAEYRPAWSREVTLPSGRRALRIGYDAPSPLT